MGVIYFLGLTVKLMVMVPKAPIGSDGLMVMSKSPLARKLKVEEGKFVGEMSLVNGC